MRRLIALVLLACLPATAWNPFDGSMKSWWISAGALVLANARDYGSTKEFVRTGTGVEGNPALTTTFQSGGPLDSTRLIVFKASCLFGLTEEYLSMRKAARTYQETRDKAAAAWAATALHDSILTEPELAALIAQYKAGYDAESAPARKKRIKMYTVGNYLGAAATGAAALNNDLIIHRVILP